MIPTFAGFNMGLSAPAAPIMDHHTTIGQFVVTNYDSNLAYTPTFISGSGTATLIDSVNGVFSLSSTDARFSISSGYSQASPQSAVGYMERKKYTTHPEPVYVDNCAPAYSWPSGNCPGPNCCNAYNNCWGGGVDGNCGADGTICCGGSRGQSIVGYNDVKNGTPEGYTDSYGEWWRIS